MSTETQTETNKAKTRKCPRCGDTIQSLPDEPLCAGCRRWARRLAEQMHAREQRRVMMRVPRAHNRKDPPAIVFSERS